MDDTSAVSWLIIKTFQEQNFHKLICSSDPEERSSQCIPSGGLVTQAESSSNRLQFTIVSWIGFLAEHDSKFKVIRWPQGWIIKCERCFTFAAYQFVLNIPKAFREYNANWRHNSSLFRKHCGVRLHRNYEKSCKRFLLKKILAQPTVGMRSFGQLSDLKLIKTAKRLVARQTEIIKSIQPLHKPFANAQVFEHRTLHLKSLVSIATSLLCRQ